MARTRKPSAVYRELAVLIRRHGIETAPWSGQDNKHVAELISELEMSLSRRPASYDEIVSDLDRWREMHASGAFNQNRTMGKVEHPGMRRISETRPSDAFAQGERQLEREYKALLAEARSLRARAKALTLPTEVRRLDEQRAMTRRRIEKFRRRWAQQPNLAAHARERALALGRVVDEARWRQPKKGHGGWVTSAGLPSLSRRG